MTRNTRYKIKKAVLYIGMGLLLLLRISIPLLLLALLIKLVFFW